MCQDRKQRKSRIEPDTFGCHVLFAVRISQDLNVEELSLGGMELQGLYAPIVRMRRLGGIQSLTWQKLYACFEAMKTNNATAGLALPAEGWLPVFASSRAGGTGL